VPGFVNGRRRFKRDMGRVRRAPIVVVCVALFLRCVGVVEVG